MAIRATTTIAATAGELQSADTYDEEGRRTNSLRSLEYLARELELDETTTEAIMALAPRYAEEREKRDAALMELSRKNSSSVAETLLALDAWKRGVFTAEQFNDVLARTWPKISLTGDSVLAAADISSQEGRVIDPLANMGAFTNEVIAGLPEDARARYLKIRKTNEEAAANVKFIPKTIESVCEYADNCHQFLEAASRLNDLEKNE